MRYYNVVRPCVVGKLHYARPTAQPIEVADEVAAPLVAEGKLEPYLPVATHSASADDFLAVQAPEFDTETVEQPSDPEPTPEAVRKTRARRGGASS